MSNWTNFLFKALHIISWLIFIGVSIDAGGVLSNTLYTLLISSNLAAHFWGYLDLSKLYQSNQAAFVTLTSLMSIVTVLKAILFYIILKIFNDKKLDLTKPFTPALGKYIYLIAYCALGIGFFSNWGGDLYQWILGQNIVIPAIQDLKLAGSDVWLLMGFVIMVFGIIFKKGIELQSENDLTV
jgi:hypothetical protein